jgi:hypothetical protein
MHVWHAIPISRNWTFAFANFQGVQTVVKDFGRDSEDPRYSPPNLRAKFIVAPV